MFTTTTAAIVGFPGMDLGMAGVPGKQGFTAPRFENGFAVGNPTGQPTADAHTGTERLATLRGCLVMPDRSATADCTVNRLWRNEPRHRITH